MENSVRNGGDSIKTYMKLMLDLKTFTFPVSVLISLLSTVWAHGLFCELIHYSHYFDA